MPFIKFSKSNINNQAISDVKNILKSGWLTHGKFTKKFENEIKKFTGAKYCTLVSSCTAALHLSCLALNLKKDDEVIVPSMTHTATAHAVEYTGAKAVFADIDIETGNIDILSIKKLINRKTKAIIVVHMAGRSSEIIEVLKICKKHKLVLLEDTCETIGAKYNNKFAGTFGLFSSISFYQSHHISSVEGGMILTNDNYYADIIRSMRANGWLREVTNKKNKKKIINKYKSIDKSFMFPYIGFNFKPTDMSAALLNNQISKLNNFIKIRTKAAKELIRNLMRYRNYLILPTINKNIKNSWFTFPIVVKKNSKFTKNQLVNYLSKNKIANRPIIAGNIAEQPFLNKFKFKKTDLSNSEIVMNSGFFIGLHHKLSENKVKKIVSLFDKFLKKKI